MLAGWLLKECPISIYYFYHHLQTLTLLIQRPLSYRNQSIGLRSKSVDLFLYDNGLRQERVKYAIYLIGIHFEQDQVPLKGMELQEIKNKKMKRIL